MHKNYTHKDYIMGYTEKKKRLTVFFEIAYSSSKRECLLDGSNCIARLEIMLQTCTNLCFEEKGIKNGGLLGVVPPPTLAAPEDN